VGGLAHFIEDEGIPTTLISLIRLHTETTTPPRALWVPFELGRPLGVPNDPEFQRRVLLSALRLFEAPKGPVLEDFAEDAPASGDQPTVMACPVDFAQEKTDLTDTEKLCAGLKKEMGSLRPWYDMTVRQRGRTTVGVSGLELDAVPDFICSFFDGRPPESPLKDVALPYALNLATDDLKAYYFEAITSQPGQESVSSAAVSDWFYGETVAGDVMYKLKEALGRSENKLLKVVGKVLIVPVSQAHRA